MSAHDSSSLAEFGECAYVPPPECSMLVVIRPGITMLLGLDAQDRLSAAIDVDGTAVCTMRAPRNECCVTLDSPLLMLGPQWAAISRDQAGEIAERFRIRAHGMRPSQNQKGGTQ